MPLHALSAHSATLLVLSGLFGGVLALAAPARAQEAPPITSAIDAACREQAKARVFSVPDPLNLGLREIGRQIYMACMQRTTLRKPARRGARLHRPRRHR